MDKYFHPTDYNGCFYLSMLVLRLKHVNKRGPWSPVCAGSETLSVSYVLLVHPVGTTPGSLAALVLMTGKSTVSTHWKHIWQRTSSHPQTRITVSWRGKAVEAIVQWYLFTGDIIQLNHIRCLGGFDICHKIAISCDAIWHRNYSRNLKQSSMINKEFMIPSTDSILFWFNKFQFKNNSRMNWPIRNSTQLRNWI